MRYETGTFELRDNDMMMRELSSAETDEVAGGRGTAEVLALAQSTGAGSTLTTSNGAFALATSNTTATAALSTNVAATGSSVLLLATSATVGPPF